MVDSHPQKRFYTLMFMYYCRAGSQVTQISVVELAVRFVAAIKKVIFMTVGTIICAAGTTYIFTSSMDGFGLTLTIVGVVLMEVANWVIGAPWAEKNSDCQR